MSDITWAPRSAWAGILTNGSSGAAGTPGLAVVALERLGIASLIAAEGGEAALVEAVTAAFGLALPQAPAIARSDSHTLAWAGPGQWLAIARTRAGFAEALQALSGLAAIADQSDGRAALRLSGGKLRETLAKGCMLDLHPNAFPVGAAALTSIAHIGVHLWRVDDGPLGPVVEIMVPRSMAGSFWSWLSASAAEFGCQVSGAAKVGSGRG